MFYGGSRVKKRIIDKDRKSSHLIKLNASWLKTARLKLETLNGVHKLILSNLHFFLNNNLDKFYYPLKPKKYGN